MEWWSDGVMGFWIADFGLWFKDLELEELRDLGILELRDLYLCNPCNLWTGFRIGMIL